MPATNVSQDIAQPGFGVDVGIVLQLADGKIQACNAAAELILGFTLEQIQGCNSNDSLWQAIHEDGSPFPGEAHPIRSRSPLGNRCLV